MSHTQSTLSTIWADQAHPYDLIWIVRNNPLPLVDFDFGVDTNKISLLPASSSTLSDTTDLAARSGIVGEVPGTSTGLSPLSRKTLKITFPLCIGKYGIIDRAAQDLWHHAMIAWRGNQIGAMSGCAAVSSTTWLLDNIWEFADVAAGTLVAFISDSGTQYSTVSEVNIKNKSLTVANPVSNNPNLVVIGYNATTPMEERGLTLVSMRYGILKPVLISEFVLRSVANSDTLEVEVEFICLGVDRRKTPLTFDSLPMVRTISRFAVNALTSLTFQASNPYSFGFSTENDRSASGIFAHNPDTVRCAEISTTISTSLEPSFLHVPSNDNMLSRHAIAAASTKRSIHVNLKLQDDIEPLSVLEGIARLSPHSPGLLLQMDGMKVNFTNVIWSPASISSSGVNPVSRTLTGQVIDGEFFKYYSCYAS